MSVISKRAVRGIVAAGAAASLVGAAVAAAPAASASSTGTVLRVAITKHGLYLNGPTTFPAGRVKVFLDAAGNDRAIQVVRLAPGYSFRDFRSDQKTAGENLFGPGGDRQKGLKALNHAIKHTTFYGGLFVQDGRIRHGILLLDDPSSRYVLYDDSGNFAKRPVHLTVTSPTGAQTLPTTSATVIARTDRRFGGDNVLPAHGNITFINRSTESPHFLAIQHVKAGTTRKEVIAAFQGQTKTNPFLKAVMGTDVVSHLHRQVLHVQLPAGRYALFCFFPDPKTGQPHAFMGMVRIVTLK